MASDPTDSFFSIPVLGSSDVAVLGLALCLSPADLLLFLRMKCHLHAEESLIYISSLDPSLAFQTVPSNCLLHISMGTFHDPLRHNLPTLLLPPPVSLPLIASITVNITTIQYEAKRLSHPEALLGIRVEVVVKQSGQCRVIEKVKGA
jgi:hypothetical protein